MDNRDIPQPSNKIPPRPGYDQPKPMPSKPSRIDAIQHSPRPSTNFPLPETQSSSDSSPVEDLATPIENQGETAITSSRRIGRRGFLRLGIGGLAAAAGALGLIAKNSTDTDKIETTNIPIEPTKVPEVTTLSPTTIPIAVQTEPVATTLPVREATPTAKAIATNEVAPLSSPVVTNEARLPVQKEIPEDVLSKEKLEAMKVRILNSPNWDLLIREGATEHSPTFQWVQNKDEEESKVTLEKYNIVVKKSMSGQTITDEERKLLQRGSKINRYYPNRSVTFVLVDESMITEEAMTPDQRAIIPADVLRKIKMAHGFEGGQLLYSPVGSDTKSVECFIFIATKPLWNNEKYTSEQSFPRAGTDVVLDEKQTNISLLDQYPLRARTTKGKNPNILVRHEDEHINSDHPVTDHNVYKGLERATQALDKGDDSEYYYVMVKKDPEGKPEEVIVGQDSNHNVSNIAA